MFDLSLLTTFLRLSDSEKQVFDLASGVFGQLPKNNKGEDKMDLVSILKGETSSTPTIHRIASLIVDASSNPMSRHLLEKGVSVALERSGLDVDAIYSIVSKFSPFFGLQVDSPLTSPTQLLDQVVVPIASRVYYVQPDSDVLAAIQCPNCHYIHLARNPNHE